MGRDARRDQDVPQLTVEIIPDPDLGGITARVPDIPAYGEGETKEEALADLLTNALKS